MLEEALALSEVERSVLLLFDCSASRRCREELNVSPFNRREEEDCIATTLEERYSADLDEGLLELATRALEVHDGNK